MPSEARTERFRTVLTQRVPYVHCAIEALHHRHNVSAILRTADSLGLHHVHLVEGRFKPVKGTARGAERWLDLKQHACSEVRASNLSGDCHWVNEMFRGYFGVENGHQKCVRRRAELSTAMNPRCRDRDEAKRVVNEVFEQCFKDTRPFDDIP